MSTSSASTGAGAGMPENDRIAQLRRDAVILLNLGLRILPVGPDKRPFIKWRGIADPGWVVDADQVKTWIRDPRTRGWAVLSGEVSGGLLTVDVEAAGMLYPAITDPIAGLPSQCRRKSPSGGAHAFVWVVDTDTVPDWSWKGGVLAKVRAASGDPVLLAEVRGARQYSVVTGPGRPGLREDFSPHRVTPGFFEGLVSGARALHDPGTDPTALPISAGAAGRGGGMVRVGDVGWVLRQAVLAEPDVWALLLDPGWTVLGVYDDYARDAAGEPLTRVCLQRPDYAVAAGGESGNALGAVLQVFSETVPWLPPDARRGLSPLDAVAYCWFAGDHRGANAAAEAAARELVELGVAPAAGSPFARWPHWLLEEVHAAHLAYLANSGAASVGVASASVGVGPLPDGAHPDDPIQLPGSGAAGVTVEELELRKEVSRQRVFQRARKIVDAELAEEAAAAVRGSRVRQTMAAAVLVPPPATVMESVLAAEVNLLCGAPGRGKTLLARDWALHVATGTTWRGHAVPEPRHVLWVASEGLHDLASRWVGQPLWSAAADRIHVVEPVNLRTGDLDWLLEEYGGERPGLVVFDLVYACGVLEENSADDVRAVTAGMRRISLEWGAATLGVGHPGHNGARRFAGSRVWRDVAFTDWFADGEALTCEKSKIADHTRLGGPYRVDYPHIRWLSTGQAVGAAATKVGTHHQAIRADFAQYPGDRVAARARRLAGALGISESRVRAYIAEVVRENAENATDPHDEES